MLQKLRQVYDGIQQTLVEGNYHAQPESIWTKLFGKKQDTLPETTEIAVGATMISTSRSFGKRMMWASAVALLSMNFLAWAALGLGAIGAGLIALEYIQCRKHRSDVITEINFAGQHVRGKRSDLCRLHMAQVRIMNLASAFKPASLESTSDTVQEIIDSVAAERKRVHILDVGRYNADDKSYDFSEPGIKLVNDKNNPAHAARGTIRVVPAAAPSLKAAWDGKFATEEEVVERLATLEQALPPHLQEKLAQRRAKPVPQKNAA
ncbi:MAG: hypothetical protein ACAH83_10735 [Alphaproteobacteria bacterium]